MAMTLSDDGPEEKGLHLPHYRCESLTSSDDELSATAFHPWRLW